jgi:hypothetical protein
VNQQRNRHDSLSLWAIWLARSRANAGYWVYWSRACFLSYSHPTPCGEPAFFQTMATKDLEPGTKVVVLFPEGLGIDEPATAMATILELTVPPTGASHHTPMHHTPELQTFCLIRHCLDGREVVESVPAVHTKAGIPDWSNGFPGPQSRFLLGSQ